MLWAAWGNGIELRAYLSKSLMAIAECVTAHDGRWLHYGSLTANGHPRHPSRTAYGLALNPFDVSGYLSARI